MIRERGLKPGDKVNWGGTVKTIKRMPRKGQ